MPVTEFKLTRAGDVALVTIDNGEDWTKPTFFGEQALASLDRLLGELEGSDFAPPSSRASHSSSPRARISPSSRTSHASARSRGHARDRSCSPVSGHCP